VELYKNPEVTREPEIIERPYIDIISPRPKKYLSEEEFEKHQEDFKRYLTNEDFKRYELKQDMLERFNIEDIRDKTTREELSGAWGEVLEDRLSEFRGTIERRIGEEIEKERKTKKEPLGELEIRKIIQEEINKVTKSLMPKKEETTKTSIPKPSGPIKDIGLIPSHKPSQPGTLPTKDIRSTLQRIREATSEKERKGEIVKIIKEWKEEGWSNFKIKNELKFFKVNPDEFKEYIK